MSLQKFRNTSTSARGHFALSPAFIAASLILNGCSQRAEVRYNVHVILDDNGVERTGDGVWAVSAYGVKFGGGAYSGGVQADAIPVSLPSRGVLLVLPAGATEQLGDVPFMLPERVLGNGPSVSFAERLETFNRLSQSNAGPVSLSCDYSHDLTDDHPGRAVEPARRSRSNQCLKLAFTDDPRRPSHLRTLGVVNGGGDLHGVLVKSISIRVVRAPITRQIDRELPWLTARRSSKSQLYVSGPGEPGIEWYEQYLRRNQ